MKPDPPNENFSSGGLTDKSRPRPSPRIPAHELIRCIGVGSYGQVWLARNEMGTYRAVKVVYRDNFSDPRPYERELNGIRKFEPVSRLHEGFVDVLQVGTNEAGGYFYYVMELGDDISSGQQINPDAYEPKTLDKEVRRLARLPFDESLKLSLSLVSALEYLHRQELIHRDIKPANIIFVNGVPKLADIGLVAGIGAARSFVGTEGFIPPEGPGTPQADLYSLGKVIYEISFGKDRAEFPELPTRFSDVPHQGELLELNEIVLKACAGYVRDRYQSAEAMRADLELLHAGKSVIRLHLLERRLRFLTKFGVAAAAVVALLVGLYFQRSKVREGRQRQAASYVAYGTRLMDEGNLFGALPWYVEAMSLESDQPNRQQLHRLRLGAVLRQSPKLVQCWLYEDRILDADFSPDGQRIVTGSESGVVQIWNAKTGEPIPPLIRLEAELSTVCFSPDGRYLVTADRNSNAIVWDAETGMSASRALIHSNEVNSARFSPDGRWLLTACADNDAYVWDWVKGECIQRLARHEGPVTSASFSPDGRRIATSSKDGSVIVWDVATWQPARQRFYHSSWVYSAVFSPDGRYLVTASFDRTARIWDLDTGQLIGQPLKHGGAIRRAEFSPDGRYVVTASYDSTARVWDALTGEPVTPSFNHGAELTSATFSPEGRHIITTSFDHTTRLWDLESSTWVPTPVPAVISALGDYVVSFTNDQVHVLNAASNFAPVASFTASNVVSEIVSNRYGTHWLTISAPFVISAVTNRTIQVWETATGKPVSPLITRTGTVIRAQLSDDGRRMAMLEDARAQVWDVVSGQPLSVPMMHTQEVATAVFSADGTRVATIIGFSARVWDAATGRPLSWGLLHNAAIRSVQFSPDGRRLATACVDSTLNELAGQVWDISTGAPIGQPLQHDDGVYLATFSPDGRRVLTASEDFTARIWDADTGVQLTPPLQHQDKVMHAAFSSDGRWIVTASLDKTVRVWDAQTGEPVTPPLIHPIWLRHAHFISNGRGILTEDYYHHVRVWPLPSENRPFKDLGLLAQWLSGLQVSRQGGAVPKTQEELRAAWGKLQSQFPGSYAASPAERLAWHERQAELIKSEQQPFAALFHLNPLVEADPQNPSLRARRGAAHAQLDHWREAAADFAKAVELGASGTRPLCDLARLQLMLRRTDDCRLTCARLVQLIAQTEDDQRASEIAWTCALAATASPDYACVLKWAKKAEADPAHHGSKSNILACLLYRCGQPAEAIAGLIRASGAGKSEDSLQDKLFLAMAQHRQGNAAEARRCLDQSVQVIEEMLHHYRDPHSRLEVPWQRRVDWELLRREAEALIGPAGR